MSEKKTEAGQETKQAENKKRLRLLFNSACEVPNGTIIKVQQSNSQSVKIILIAKDGTKDEIIISPAIARAIHALLGGCLNYR